MLCSAEDIQITLLFGFFLKIVGVRYIITGALFGGIIGEVIVLLMMGQALALKCEGPRFKSQLCLCDLNLWELRKMARVISVLRICCEDQH